MDLCSEKCSTGHDKLLCVLANCKNGTYPKNDPNFTTQSCRRLFKGFIMIIYVRLLFIRKLLKLQLKLFNAYDIHFLISLKFFEPKNEFNMKAVQTLTIVNG